MVAHVERILAKVTEFGFTYDNHIFLKGSRAFPKNPFYTYLMIIAFHETVSTSYDMK